VKLRTDRQTGKTISLVDVITIKRALTPRCRNVCLRRYNIYRFVHREWRLLANTNIPYNSTIHKRLFVMMTLSLDLWHWKPLHQGIEASDNYLWQVALKSVR